jgi:hypothetical protein
LSSTIPLGTMPRTTWSTLATRLQMPSMAVSLSADERKFYAQQHPRQTVRGCRRCGGGSLCRRARPHARPRLLRCRDARGPHTGASREPRRQHGGDEEQDAAGLPGRQAKPRTPSSINAGSVSCVCARASTVKPLLGRSSFCSRDRASAHVIALLHRGFSSRVVY